MVFLLKLAIILNLIDSFQKHYICNQFPDAHWSDQGYTFTQLFQ